MTDYLNVRVSFLYDKKEEAVKDEPDIRELFSGYGFTVSKVRKVQMNNVYRIAADIKYEELLKKLATGIDPSDEEAVTRYFVNIQEIVDEIIDGLPESYYQIQISTLWVINDKNLVY